MRGAAQVGPEAGPPRPVTLFVGGKKLQGNVLSPKGVGNRNCPHGLKMLHCMKHSFWQHLIHGFPAFELDASTIQRKRRYPTFKLDTSAVDMKSRAFHPVNMARISEPGAWSHTRRLGERAGLASRPASIASYTACMDVVKRAYLRRCSLRRHPW